MIGLIKKIFKRTHEEKPSSGYDRWAASYDQQPGNLVLQLDEELLNSFLQDITLTKKLIADIGCGTGRHWPLLLRQQPQAVTGFDVSAGMLEKLTEKFPEADVHLLQDHRLPVDKPGSFDFILSTLTIAHIENIAAALAEWNRVLRPGSTILITDYHPEALQRNARRTFRDGNKTIAVKSHVHRLDLLRQLTKQLGWTEIRFAERKIDEAVKHVYEQQGAAALYQQFFGMPLIYGIQFKKL